MRAGSRSGGAFPGASGSVSYRSGPRPAPGPALPPPAPAPSPCSRGRGRGASPRFTATSACCSRSGRPGGGTRGRPAPPPRRRSPRGPSSPGAGRRRPGSHAPRGWNRSIGHPWISASVPPRPAWSTPNRVAGSGAAGCAPPTAARAARPTAATEARAPRTMPNRLMGTFLPHDAPPRIRQRSAPGPERQDGQPACPRSRGGPSAVPEAKDLGLDPPDPGGVEGRTGRPRPGRCRDGRPPGRGTRTPRPLRPAASAALVVTTNRCKVVT
jgi:hypothetical protein